MTQETLIPARQVCLELGNISIMTLRRWRVAGSVPEPITIRGRNYWRRSQIELLKTEGDGSSTHPAPHEMEASN